VNILERILEAKRAEVAAAKEMLGEAAVAARARAQSPPRDFTGALRAKLAAGRPAVIGEIKRASPSRGVLREKTSMPRRSRKATPRPAPPVFPC